METRMENKALGKGLSALIQKTAISESATLEKNSNEKPIFLKTIEIAENRVQPRENYDRGKLDELKASIREKGIIQPILVRPVDGRYEVVAGQRRLRVAVELGLEQVPVYIRPLTDRESLVLALVENIQRQELNAIEEAKGFKRLIEEFGYSQEAVATSIGKDRSTIANLMRLLKLPTEIQDFVVQDKISAGHARSILVLESKEAQIKLAMDIVKMGLSVRQVEAMVKPKEGAEVNDNKKAKSPNRDIAILEEELCQKLGTKVNVLDKNNKGKLVIEYYSLDDLDRILRVLRR